VDIADLSLGSCKKKNEQKTVLQSNTGDLEKYSQASKVKNV